MVSSDKLFNRHRAGLFVTLVTLLASVYMLTYSARIESGDSRLLFDATNGLVRYGDFLLGLSAADRLPQTFDTHDLYPLPPVNAEPLQMVLSAPLYWLADKLPDVGLVHAVWLFNVVVCAAAGGVFFFYAIALGYHERTAVLAALAFGLGTILWPYSKSFFREPLTLLTILLAALSIERWRAGHYRSYRLLGAVVLAVVAAMLTRVASLMVLPALVLIALPDLRHIGRRWWIGLLIALALFAGVFILMGQFADLPGIGGKYLAFYRLFQASLEYVPVALQSYLLSIGGSIWGTSPIILLAIPGFWLLYRQSRPRYLGVALLLLLTFSIGYAALSRQHWFGGLSWPPRFLVPVVPFVMIGALPLFDRLTRRPIARWLWVGSGLLFAYSLWVQFSGVSLWWGEYTQTLPPEANGLIEWGGGLNVLQYLRWVTIPPLWSHIPLDFAWVRTGVVWWPVAFGVLALICATGLWHAFRQKPPPLSPELNSEGKLHGRAEARPYGAKRVGRDALLGVRLRTPDLWVIHSQVWGGVRGGVKAAALPAALIALTWLGLRAIYRDNLYLAWNQPLFDLIPRIKAESRPGDVLLLSESSYPYDDFLMNYGKFNTPRVVTLPVQPGDQPSPDQPPQVVSDNPDMLLTNLTAPLIYTLAATRDRLWLLTDAGPDIPWSVRAVERFMTAHYYPIQEINTGPTTRLIEYSTVDAPDPYAFRGADTVTGLIFGDGMRLAGYNLPSGTTYTPGQALPVSLYWQADAALAGDYTVALYLGNDGGKAAQGMDSQPAGGFSHTSGWPVGLPLWDNRAMRLPADLPPGEYDLWVKVYTFAPDGSIQILPASGGQIQDGNIAVLPATITVR